MNVKAGHQLAKAREKSGFKQHQLAGLLAKKLKQGYTTRQYQKLEGGDFPKYKKQIVKAVDEILGSSIFALVYEQKDEQIPSSPNISPGIERKKPDLSELFELVVELREKIEEMALNSGETNSIVKSHYTSHLGYSEAIGRSLDRISEDPEGTLSALADTIDQKIWKRLQQKGIDAIVRK